MNGDDDPVAPEDIAKLFRDVEAAADDFRMALEDFRTKEISLITHAEFRRINNSIRALPESLRDGKIREIARALCTAHVWFLSLPSEDQDWVLNRIHANWASIIKTAAFRIRMTDLIEDAQRGFNERKEDLRSAAAAAKSTRVETRKALIGALESLTGAGLVVEDVFNLLTAPNPAKTASIFVGLTLFWRGTR
jgi:hypothetical protein